MYQIQLEQVIHSFEWNFISAEKNQTAAAMFSYDDFSENTKVA